MSVVDDICHDIMRLLRDPRGDADAPANLPPLTASRQGRRSGSIVYCYIVAALAEGDGDNGGGSTRSGVARPDDMTTWKRAAASARDSLAHPIRGSFCAPHCSQGSLLDTNLPPRCTRATTTYS